MSAPAKPAFSGIVISPPVKEAIAKQAPDAPKPIDVIITLAQLETGPEPGITHSKSEIKTFLQARGYKVRESDFYVFASLLPADIFDLADQRKWVHRIWKDETTYTHLLSSTETIKASACWRTFEARGKGICWAVLDTGIRADHPHFQGIVKTDLCRNFSNSPSLDDQNGHGSHVAGIIAGSAKGKADGTPYHAATYIEEQDDPEIIDLSTCPSGVAPLTNLVSVKILDDDGTGSASSAILGLEYLRKLNQNSRDIIIDGVNMSLGYPFDPKWFGCGHSPLCDEVQRAVDSGLVVVISCGNSGYGFTKLDTGEQVPYGIGLSITDPANARDGIAVGSVHKLKPHTFGVSYFSSKGPTGDGRHKPDLVAPGEKIISCSIHTDKGYEYEERSGTSMAAPHVSGAIAAFLSVYSEFRGDPLRIKDIFLKSATDLQRGEDFQGAGMVDLMRAITSI
ncbi:MAG TPA: S8 family peptidase [Acidisarcina sp.]